MSFPDYIAHGWKLCIIPPGSKGPRGKGWNLRENAVPIEQASRIMGAGLMHAYSGTCAIDFDNLEVARPFLAEHGVDMDELLLRHDNVHLLSGRPNRDKLIFALPEPLPSVKLAEYEIEDETTGKPKKFYALELRCGTAEGLTVQDVLPPTIHPITGLPYRWAYGDEIMGSWRNLPPLPEQLVGLWSKFRDRQPDPLSLTGPQAAIGADLAEIQALLADLNPDMSHDEWVEIGMIVHHETRGSAAGLALWDEWSRQGEKYGQAPPGGRWQPPSEKWASFRYDHKNPRTLGSLRREAVAKPEEFPVSEPVAASQQGAGGEFPNEPDRGVDTRPVAVVRQILEPLVLVTSQGAYYDRRCGELIAPFTVQHQYTPQMPLIRVESKTGTRMIRPEPLEELRKAGWKEVVYGVGMNPGGPEFFAETGRRYVNKYQDPKIQPLTPRPHEIEAFRFMFSRIDEDVFQRWLLKFYGHAVQHPGVKITSAPLLVGEKTGSGKNTLMKVIPDRLFTRRWTRVMTSATLRSDFSDKLADAWWLYFEELHAGASKMERINVTNRVKSWITDEMIEVHPKGGKPYDVMNRIQITASSNYEDALQLDNNDRRWCVGHIAKEMTEAEGVQLYDFLKSERAPGVLRSLFQSVDITGFNPQARAPMTASKRVMIAAGLGAWESTVLELMLTQQAPFNRDIFELKELYPYVAHSGITMNRLSRLMKGEPFNCVSYGSISGARLMCWRNSYLWDDISPAVRLRHLETGFRPEGSAWEEGIPLAIRRMAAADEPDEEIVAETPAGADTYRDLIFGADT